MQMLQVFCMEKKMNFQVNVGLNASVLESPTFVKMFLMLKQLNKCSHIFFPINWICEVRVASNM